jgi:hypothetical protein
MLYNDNGQGHDKVNNGYRSFAYKAGFPAFITFYYPLMPLDKLFSITHQGPLFFDVLQGKQH